MASAISDTLDTLEAMVCQEERVYHPASMMDEDQMIMRFPPMALESRRRMMIFYYDLVEKVGSSRETVEIAVSFLDRFLAAPIVGPQALANKRLFQLMATTCIYTAVKIHETQAIAPSLLADLSQGVFTAQDIEEMESLLLQTLRWRLNPPTSAAFVRLYLDLVPDKLLSRELKSIAYTLAEYQTEYALTDERLFYERKAAVAYWAVENTLEQLHIYDEELSAYMTSAVFGSYGMSVEQGDALLLLHMVLSEQLEHIMPSYNRTTVSQHDIVPSASTTQVAKSWFSFGPRSSSPTSKSEYHVSPRSVGNSSMA